MFDTINANQGKHGPGMCMPAHNNNNNNPSMPAHGLLTCIADRAHPHMR
jgi:hypothetical protein